MFAANILAYPEFLAVALLTFVFVGVRSQATDEQSDEPGLLHQAALAVLAVMPLSYREWLSRRQMWAGMRTHSAVGDFAAAKALLSLSSLLLVLCIPPLAALPIAAVVYFLPDAYLLVAVARRRREISEALPQALDLMVLCVDAGLGLDAALQRISADSSVTSAALNEELSALGRDILLGMERARAYQEIYRRSGVEELKMLGSALNQSTKLGLSVGRILRAQAEFLRARQSQRAEEKAAKLPVWMAFPLWFCIMPALLFVIIGPTFITFIKNIGHVMPAWFN
jgi:tight adherence protein C